MTGAAKDQRTHYYEFCFPTFIADVAERECDINETIYDEDDAEADFGQRLQLLGGLAYEATQNLELQGCIGHEATFSPSALLPPQDLLQNLGIELVLHAGEEPEEGNTLSAAGFPLPLQAARYEGLTLLPEQFSEANEVSYSRARIYHKLLLGEAATVSAFVQQTTKVYAFQPLDNLHLQVLSPVLAYSPNEKWLTRISRDALQVPGEGLDAQKLEAIFQQISTAHPAYGDHQKNLDWLYDQLEDRTRLRGRSVSLTTGGYQLTTSTGEKYYDAVGEVQGVVLGYGSMSVFRHHKGSIYEDDKAQQLALILEVEYKGETCLARVPLGLCPREDIKEG